MFCVDIAGFIENDNLHVFVKLLVKLPTEVIVKIFFSYTDKEGLLTFKKMKVIYWLEC